jgi:hypothetical protein
MRTCYGQPQSHEQGRGNVRHRLALENDVEQCDQVRDGEESGAHVETVDVPPHRPGDSDERETDTQFDKDYRDAVKDFEQEEPLANVSKHRAIVVLVKDTP